MKVPILWAIILGKKKFLFGDNACEFDCTIFAIVAQLIWQMPGSPIKAYIEGNFNMENPVKFDLFMQWGFTLVSN